MSLARSLTLAALLAPALLPSSAEAQRRRYPRPRTERVIIHTSRDDRWQGPERRLSLLVGALNVEQPGDDTNFPMAALRAEWRLGRFVRSELGASFALGEFAAVAPGGEDVSSSLATATLGVQAEMPLPFIRPYVGAAAGLHGRWDEGDGASFVRPTISFPAGVRLPLSSRLALRAEARWRFDEQESGASAINVEQTAGLSVAF
jgi:hypothetical protein